MKVGELFAELFVDDTEYNKGIDKAESRMSSFGKAAKGTILGVAAGFGTAAVSGVKMATDVEKSTDQMQATLGTTAEEAKNLEEVARDVWEQGFGASLQDVQSDVTTLRQNLGEMSQETMSEVTEAAATIEELFGATAEESSKVVKTLRDNFDGLSETDAFDIITTGFQEGGDYAGDLLDTLNEYAPQFADLGMNADEFLGILIKGAEEGAFNMDKVGDAVKELNNTIINDEATEALNQLGLDAGKLTEQFQQGGEASEGAFQAILAGLANIEDPVERNKVGVALFKSQWEDLGPTVVTSMAEGTKGVEDFEGSTAEAGENSKSNLIGAFQEISRSIQNDLIEKFQPVQDALSDIASRAAEGFETEGFSGAIKAMLPEGFKDDLSTIAQGFSDIKSAMEEGDWQGVANVVSEAIDEAINELNGFSKDVEEKIREEMAKINWAQVGKESATGAIGFVLGLVSSLMNPQTWISVVQEHWQTILGLIAGVIFAPAKWIGVLNRGLGKIPFVGTIVKKITKSLNDVGGKIKGKARELGTELIEGIKRGFGTAFPSVGTKLGNGIRRAVQSIGKFGSRFMEKGKELMRNLGQGIGSSVGTVLTYLRGLFDNLTSFIARQAGRFLSKGKDIAKSVGNGIASMASWVGGKMSSIVSSIGKGLRKAVVTVAGIGGDIIKGLWSGIQNMAGWISRKVSGFIDNWVKKPIKKILEIFSPSRWADREIGRNLVRGLIRGMVKSKDEATNAVSDLMNAIKDAFDTSTTTGRIRAIRGSEIDLLEDQIEYLTRATASEKELALAKEKQIELDELRSEKQVEFQNRISYQKNVIDELNKAFDQGKFTQAEYNELISDATEELNNLKSESLDFNASLKEEQQEAIDSFVEQQEELRDKLEDQASELKDAIMEQMAQAAEGFSSMAESQTEAYEKAMDEQLSAMEDKHERSVEAFENETDKVLEEIDRQKEAALEAYDEETQAREDAINKQIEAVERRKEAELSAIDEQLNALDDQEQRDERNEQRGEWEEERSTLTRRIQVAELMDDDETLKEAKRELAAFEEEVAKQQKEWRREDKREALEDEKDKIESQYDQQVSALENQIELMEAQREKEREQLEARYEKRAEQYEKEREQQLAAMQQLYADREAAFEREMEQQIKHFEALEEELAKHVEEGKLTQADAQKAWNKAMKEHGNEQVQQQIANQEAQKKALNSFVSDYLEIGKSFGSSITDGIKESLYNQLAEVKLAAARIRDVIDSTLASSNVNIPNQPNVSAAGGGSTTARLNPQDIDTLSQAVASRVPNVNVESHNYIDSNEVATATTRNQVNGLNVASRKGGNY